MRITAIGHAALLVEAAGLRILSDPWWRGPCFGAQWWNHPPPRADLATAQRLDYIYISHGHHDHLHPGTLRTLDRQARVIVAAGLGLATPIRELGFEVIEAADGQPVDLGNGVTCRVMRTHGDDTLMVVSDGRETCVNLNDSLHSAPDAVQQAFVARLRSLHPVIDYVFCGYGVASHFPNCYDIPGKDRVATAARRQAHFNRSWARLIDGLSPRFGFPFAADVVFLEHDLFWVNEPTHNLERPTAVFRVQHPQSPVQVIDIAPGFVIEDGNVVSDVLRAPVLDADVRRVHAEAIERANRHGSVPDGDVDEVLRLLDGNLANGRAFLASFDGDYRFLIEFHNSTRGIEVVKRGTTVETRSVTVSPTTRRDYDVTYRTRLAYLRRSYSEPFGDEILFVGSGGIFTYRDAAQARRNLHRELKFVLTRQPHPVPPRPRPGLAALARRAAKRMLGREEADLYDLGTWTVFAPHAASGPPPREQRAGGSAIAR
jgi:hypothetical protein